jgi:peptide/nickel transport system ATP-binding protein
VDLLEVSGLNVGLAHSPHRLLRNVSYTVKAGEIVGLVGESGSGKTMASLAVMGLLPAGVEWRGGSVRLDGRELVRPEGGVERAAGDITMIFQDPRGALNPTMRVGRQIARVLRIAQGMDKKDARDQSVEMLSHVGIPGAARVARAYPHQLSGGMCQRVMIAMALACRPKVLIADEPTTALDVTIQAQIFDLIKTLVAETGCGVLFITHDLGAVAEICDRVEVLYGGQVMESGTTVDIFEGPQNPYTRFLFEAVERHVDPRTEERGADHTLEGCRFAHRCPYTFDRCGEIPPFVEVMPGHRSACHLHVKETVAAS